LSNHVHGASTTPRPDPNAAVRRELAREHHAPRPLAWLLVLALIVAGGTGLAGWLTHPGGILAASSSGQIVLQDTSPALHWSAGWKVVSVRSASGGSVHVSGTAGASVSLVYYGSYLQVLALTGRGDGLIRVTLDGTTTSVSTHATTFHPQKVVFAAGPPNRRHVLTIRVAGTPGHPFVAIDAVIISPLQAVTPARPGSNPGPRATPTPKPTPTPVPAQGGSHPTPPPTPAPPTPAPPVSSNCSGTLQSQINAAGAGATLNLTGCTFNGGATIAKPLTLVGAKVNVASGHSGLTISANDVTINGLTITGPQSHNLVDGEDGIDVGSAISRLTIENSDIGQFGQGGLWLGSVTTLTVRNNHIHDAFYAGIMVLSGNGGTISNNLVERIGVGWTTGGSGGGAGPNNSYGIGLTYAGSGPVTTGFTVSGNTVQDVPVWHCLDTHSGTHIVFSNNTLQRCSRAIFITTSSSRASNIQVTGNQFLSPGPVTFNLEAVTTVSTDNVTITGNTLTGWGGNTFEDYGNDSTGLVISGNTVTQ
jgi:parallel beta-helix repeat protein